MADIRHKVAIQAKPNIVYKAIASEVGLRGWWTPDATAKKEVGSTLRFGFGPTYFKEMKVLSLMPNEKVEWKCISGTDEWIGTIIRFDISKEEDRSVLYFAHKNWDQQTEMFSQCSYDWAMFLRSLKQYCERGKGLPFPNQHQ